MSNRFRVYDDPECTKSINYDKKKLIRQIRTAGPKSPYPNFDISNFIIDSEMLENRNIEESELDEIISEAISFFRKGGSTEIKKIIIEKLNLNY